MGTNRRVTGRAMSLPAGIAVGVCVSLGMTLAGAVLLGVLMDGETLQMNSVGYGSMVILLVSSMTGPLVAKSLIKHRALLVCMASGAGYYLTLLAMTALFFGGQYHGMGVTALVVLAGTGCTMLLGLKSKKTGNYSFKKMLYR